MEEKITVNDEYLVTILKQDHFGRGIARIHNMLVFVENGLPSDFCKIKITAHILFLCYQILYTYALSRYISLYHLYTPCFHISCIYFIFLHTIYALFFPILSKCRLSYCIQHQLYNSCSLHCHPLLPFCGMQALRLFPLH